MSFGCWSTKGCDCESNGREREWERNEGQGVELIGLLVTACKRLKIGIRESGEKR